MTRGKIVLVPFPFDDLSTAQVRPAVCLTEPTGPQRHVVLAFSSGISISSGICPIFKSTLIYSKALSYKKLDSFQID